MLYQAPEVLRQGGRTAKADMYAFGIVAIEVLTRDPPYALERDMIDIARKS